LELEVRHGSSNRTSSDDDKGKARPNLKWQVWNERGKLHPIKKSG